MKFQVALLASALAALVAADGNAFTAPGPDDVLKANEPFVVKWRDTTGDKVNLYLKKGKSDNLDTVMTIAKDLANNGAVRWKVPATLETGSDYALEIQVSDSEDEINYTSQFKIEGNKEAAFNATRATTSSEASTSSSVASSTALNSTTVASTTASSNLTTTSGASSKTQSVITSTKTAGASGSSSGSTGAASTTSSSTGAAGFINVNNLALAGGLGAALLAL